MVEIVPLLQPSTAADIRAGFERIGSISVDVADLKVDVADWRRIARQVARDLGRSVTTTADTRVVTAWLNDWPRDPEEERRGLEASRAAVEAVSQRVLRGHRPDG